MFQTKELNFLFIGVLLVVLMGSGQQQAVAQADDSFSIARIKYRGGGDWYNNPSALKNLISFTKNQVPISINPNYKDVAIGSSDLFNYPFAYLTGHGSITVNNAEISNVREYLKHGGFLYIDDDYGLDEYARYLISKLFPNEELIEIPFDHLLYHTIYDFNNGPPKIHKHDGKAPRGYGVFYEGRLVIYYTYESNVSDGWADPNVHKDPEPVRQKAFRMGANILVYALTN